MPNRNYLAGRGSAKNRQKARDWYNANREYALAQRRAQRRKKSPVQRVEREASCARCGLAFTVLVWPNAKRKPRKYCTATCRRDASNDRPEARAQRKRYAKSVVGRAATRRCAHRTQWPKKIMSTYGITVEDYAWMMHAQGFRCAICEQPFTQDPVANEMQGKRVKPNVDHCHKTGRVRGIVCGWCNYRFLGPLERGGIRRAQNAMRYLGWSAPEIYNHEGRTEWAA